MFPRNRPLAGSVSPTSTTLTFRTTIMGGTHSVYAYVHATKGHPRHYSINENLALVTIDAIPY